MSSPSLTWLEEEILNKESVNKRVIYSLAGTKGDRFTINQTPDMAWGQAWLGDIPMEMTSGSVGEGQVKQKAQQGGNSKESQGTWCPGFQDTKARTHPMIRRAQAI